MPRARVSGRAVRTDRAAPGRPRPDGSETVPAPCRQHAVNCPALHWAGRQIVICRAVGAPLPVAYWTVGAGGGPRGRRGTRGASGAFAGDGSAFFLSVGDGRNLMIIVIAANSSIQQTGRYENIIISPEEQRISLHRHKRRLYRGVGVVVSHRRFGK